MNRADLMTKREAILRIASQRGARKVRLFGSMARGESTEASDVDFLVEFEPGRSLLDHGGLVMDLQDLLGCKVDVISDRGLRARFRQRIESEAIAL